MSPFLSLDCAGGFGSLHSLFRIYTEDQPHGHVLTIRQLQNYVRDLSRIAFQTPFESSQHLQERTDRGLIFRQQVRRILNGARAQSARIPPGSSVQTLTPNGATSIARESLKPPNAHLAA